MNGRWNSFVTTECNNHLPQELKNRPFRESAPISPAISGVGWDIVTGSSKLPLYELSYGKNIVRSQRGAYYFPDDQTVQAIPQNLQPTSSAFDTIGEFLNMLSFPQDSNDAILRGVRGGLYATRPDIINFYSQTFKDLTKFSHSRVDVKAFQVTLGPTARLSQTVLQAFDYLAQNPSDENFSSFIQYFGTHAVQSAVFGGIAEQDVVVQNIAFCSGFTDYDMTENSKAELLDHCVPGSGGNPPSHTQYIEHRSLGVVDIKGGNPELTDWSQRIGTFEADPIIVEADVVPIWTLPSQPVVQQGLKRAIDGYMKPQFDKLHSTAQDLKERTLIPVYRYCSLGRVLDHMVLFSTGELGCQPNNQNYVLEGVLGYAPTTPGALGSVELYRLFNPHGDHLFTTSMDEVQQASRQGYHFEMVSGYVFPSQCNGCHPIYRFRGPNNDHLYQDSPNAPPRYAAEGIAFYLSDHSYLS